jgi:NAD(P)-dependent dehydrogenase (short-subunit alcohol dehydrogenase family)
MSDALFSLKDRTVVVTGAAGQLGRAFTRALTEAGARVAGVDLAPVAESERVRGYACNISDRGALEGTLAAIEKEWGTPHGLVNNAAIDAPPNAPAEENGPFETYPRSSWDRVMEINVTGMMQCCQVFGGAMARAGRGSIVNVASIYGMVSPDQSLYQYRRDRGEVFFKPVAYAVSKSAVYNLTRYLAVYWGNRNVRVNTVTFGGVFNNQEAAFLDGYHRKVPLGRMANADEYNGVVRFLLSDAATYVTGANLVADGGLTAM